MVTKPLLSPPSIKDELLYPDSDGKPLADNTTQLRLIFTIKGGLDALFKDRDDVFVAADLLWYPVKLTQQLGEIVLHFFCQNKLKLPIWS